MAVARKTLGPATPWATTWKPGTARKTTASVRDFTVAKSAQKSGEHLLSVGGSAAHPFADAAIASELRRREQEIEDAFERITFVLRDLAPLQFDEGFADLALSRLSAIGVTAERDWFIADWTKPLDLSAVHARCVSRLFARQVETGSERVRYRNSDEGEPVDTLVERWGFHAVDITACADGRLSGLLGAVLRVPFSIVSARRSYAGAMFPVADALGDWEQVELRRWREAAPEQPDASSKYLKIGVYHFSSVDPQHEGCAAHGSDDNKAVSKLLDRLIEFKGAVRSKHGAEGGVALFMVGVDTDTDAIRVHVPDANGRVHADRFVSSADLHGFTASMSKPDAKAAVREAVAKCTGVSSDDPATEGMRWFSGYLLKNNISQVDAVLRKYNGPYPVAGHAEKLIVIGDPIDDVQLRNLAFQAQMTSVEEGAGDLAVGYKILGARCAAENVAVPVLVVRDFDPEIPGDKDAARSAAKRMRVAACRQSTCPVAVEAAVRPVAGGSLQFLTCGNSVSNGLRAAP